ncbi:hypothetical protein C2857_001608 [Epichloe festucae Fl1]|uniref:Small-subunit processome Utp12 domain-containing protein n=1 Tax=Epichloe festucae (strain Fl1) TaxID=877507 RepID=A0A7S9KK04_EPIFF|nr:hypothetical protein C2857_001608 [Epichloe festucae Fl1]
MSTKRKAPSKLPAPVVKSSAKVPTKNTIDETRASIAGTDALQGSQVEIVEISSSTASDDDDDDEDISDAEMEAAEQVNGSSSSGSSSSKRPNQETAAARISGKHTKNVEDEAEEESDNEETSPSFGELLRGNDAIDVPALLQQSASGNMTTQPARTATLLDSHQSLKTVLTQALKTDDTELLESCLHITDLPTMTNTIERIDSSLAGNLLSKIAARLHRRPGRAGTLMAWVQWILILHGGALASQPKVVHSLNGLQKVLAERAKGLDSLLALKGKLDVLERQLELRRKMQRTSGLLRHGGGSDDNKDDDVIWVEGETDSISRKDVCGSARPRAQTRNTGADDGEDEDDLHLVNGKGDSEDDDDDDDEDSDAREEDDSDEAEESLDENEVDHEDVDESMGEDEESDVEAAPPSKMQKVSRAFSERK